MVDKIKLDKLLAKEQPEREQKAHAASASQR
jgi:hypothetical protein